VKTPFFPETGAVAARVGILFIGFIVPLVFSIRLEDGFELTQTLCAPGRDGFFTSDASKRGLVVAFEGQWPLYFSFFGFWATGVYSFLGLAHSTSFYFPTQNYLWVLSTLLFLIPVGLSIEKEKLYAFLALSGVLGSFYSFAQALAWILGGGARTLLTKFLNPGKSGLLGGSSVGTGAPGPLSGPVGRPTAQRIFLVHRDRDSGDQPPDDQNTGSLAGADGGSRSFSRY